MQCISECITVSGITCNLRKTLAENMFTQGHFVNAEIRIKADADIQQALAAIEQFCADMNSEAGCSFAMALQDKQDPRRIILWERYEDEAASQRHFDEPHTQRFIHSGLTEFLHATLCQLPVREPAV